MFWNHKVAVLLIIFPMLFATIGGCSSDAGQDEEHEQQQEDRDEDREKIFRVNSEVTPEVEHLEDDREVAAMVDERGEQFEFVADEFLLVGDDDALQGFVDRWDATVLSTSPFDEFDADLDPIHRVQIDPADGDPEAFVELLEELDIASSVRVDVSDEEVLGLLSIAAMEITEGVRLGINPIMEFHGDSEDFITGELSAASEGDDHVGLVDGDYSSNPFDWLHLNRSPKSKQDIGVTDAWRAMALADELTPSERVRIAIFDGGFIDYDLPPGSQAESFGEENPTKCSGGNDCPWHGIAVTSVALGQPNSGKGVSGTGGPVGTATMVGFASDFGTFTERLSAVLMLTDDLLDLVDEPPEIVNMSFGGAIPLDSMGWLWDLAEAELDSVFGVLRSEGVLSLSSSGNAGDNMDQTCGEEECYFHLPCEFDSVMCIGGLDPNERYHDDNSNYGDAVDLWAPYTVYVGFDSSGDPDDFDNEAHQRTGTSYSSPYVAGVAALIMSIDSSLSASQVQDLLEDTARDGDSDPAGIARVDSYIQADEAVYEALDDRFEFALIDPDDGSAHIRGERLAAEAIVDFPSDISTSEVFWHLDGQLLPVEGTQPDISGEMTADWEPGEEVELQVSVFVDGHRLRQSVEFEVINDPPIIEIVSPNDGGHVGNSGFNLVATTGGFERGLFRDLDDVPDDHEVTWRIDGEVVADGHRAMISGFNQGDQITVEAEVDDGYATATDEVTVDVIDTLTSIDVVIIKPLEILDDTVFTFADKPVPGESDWMAAEIDLEAIATDFSHDEGFDVSGEMSWTTTADINGDGETDTWELGVASSLTVDLFHAEEGMVEHQIEARVHGTGGPATAETTVKTVTDP